MDGVKQVISYKQMIYSLVRKDLRGRYKGSALGFLWTFVNPTFQLLIYTFVFSVILRSDIEKFYLYLFVALIPWIFFQSSISGGATAVTSQKDLVKKIYFPREVLPISYVTSCFINMLLCFTIIFIVVIISGVGINISAIFCLPIVMLVEYILALGMAFLSSSITVYFRDLEHILGIITMAWMYLTPILYSKSIVPSNLLPLYNINPMTPIIEAYRDILYYKQIPRIETLGQGLLLGIFILILGWFVFRKLNKHFAEEL